MGDLGSLPGLGRSPGEGKGYPLQYSGLENSIDCIVHGVVESDTNGRLQGMLRRRYPAPHVSEVPMKTRDCNLQSLRVKKKPQKNTKWKIPVILEKRERKWQVETNFYSFLQLLWRKAEFLITV